MNTQIHPLLQWVAAGALTSPFSIPLTMALVVPGVALSLFDPAPASSPVGPGAAGLNFTQLKLRYQPAPPSYPPLARIQGIQGTVVVEILINSQGLPESAKTIQGPLELRATAEAYAMGWRFEPALLNGRPQAARFRLTMPFRLRAPADGPITAVIELAGNTPEAQNLLPGLREAWLDSLRQVGVAVVPAEGADPAKVQHFRLTVDQAPGGLGAVTLSLRCSLLKDLRVTGNEPGQPVAVTVGTRTFPTETDPKATLNGQLLPLLREALGVPQITPRTPPATQERGPAS